MTNKTKKQQEMEELKKIWNSVTFEVQKPKSFVTNLKNEEQKADLGNMVL